MSVPSLQELCIQKIAPSLNKQISIFYRDNPRYTASKDSLDKTSDLWEKICRLWKETPVAYEDKLVQALPPRIFSHPDLFSPWILSALERCHPSLAMDGAWKKMYEMRYPTAHTPIVASYKEAYLLRHLIDAYIKAGSDFRKAPPNEIALYLNNGHEIHRLELPQRSPLFSDSLLKCITKNAQKITHLQLRGSTSISDDGLRDFIRACPYLIHFNAGAHLLTVPLLKELSSLKSLKSVNLSLVQEIVNFAQIEKLLLSLPGIEELSLSHSEGMSDGALASLIERMPNLKKIKIYQADTLSAGFFDELFQRRNINILSLESCLKISSDTLTDRILPFAPKVLEIQGCAVKEEDRARLLAKFPSALIKLTFN